MRGVVYSHLPLGSLSEADVMTAELATWVVPEAPQSRPRGQPSLPSAGGCTWLSAGARPERRV
jgi:hypothetical protein